MMANAEMTTREVGNAGDAGSGCPNLLEKLPGRPRRIALVAHVRTKRVFPIVAAEYALVRSGPVCLRTALVMSSIPPKELCPKSTETVVGERVQMKEPLVRHIYTADPSAHVFDGRVYVYPSHDLDLRVEENDDGAHFQMVDYRVLSMDDLNSPVIEHGTALHIEDVPWASRQMWAPDVAKKGDRYYFYFPARDHEGRFRIGVATGTSPVGPFVPRPESIPGSYSIDPCAFADDDGEAYLYFGGLWGGQLEKWQTGSFVEGATGPDPEQPAIGPRVARLTTDMLRFASPPSEICINDESGNPLLAKDTDRRYFEGPWMHKYRGKYYFSYSTGDTHYLVYATGDSPLGPFTYQGRILNPVVGWTTHHSIVQVGEDWYLFYHDSSLSGGITHQRCVKVQPLEHDEQGRIVTLDP
jgi:hypothetical protein